MLVFRKENNKHTSNVIRLLAFQHKCWPIHLHYSKYTACSLATSKNTNRIGGVMVCVLALSVADRDFEPGRVNSDHTIGVRCFPVKHTVLMS
jgi:hypothetical protein